MLNLAFELLIRFCWGSFLVLLFVRRTESSERFVKIAYYIILGTLLFTQTLLVFQKWNPAYELCLGALALGGAIYTFNYSRIGRTLGASIFLLAPAFYLFEQSFDRSVNFFTSALVLGGVLGSQFVGHWYLTVAGLNISELKRVTNLTITGLLLKTCEIAWTLWSHRYDHLNYIDEFGRSAGIALDNPRVLEEIQSLGSPFAIFGNQYFGLGTYGIILLVSRLLWGILAPVILVFMVRAAVKTRSTQSATGILYAMSVMVIIGEALALYLFERTNWGL